MANPWPQTDKRYDLSGAADVWDEGAAGAILQEDFFAESAATASGAAPLSAVAAITATGFKSTSSGAPLSATANIVALGAKRATTAAPVSGTATIIVFGAKASSSPAPLSATATIIATGSGGSVAATEYPYPLLRRRRR